MDTPFGGNCDRGGRVGGQSVGGRLVGRRLVCGRLMDGRPVDRRPWPDDPWTAGSSQGSSASLAAASIAHGMSLSRFHLGAPLEKSGVMPRLRFPRTRSCTGSGGSSGSGGASNSAFPFGVKNTTCPFRSLHIR